jgi:hypothetical protein
MKKETMISRISSTSIPAKYSINSKNMISISSSNKTKTAKKKRKMMDNITKFTCGVMTAEASLDLADSSNSLST